ncbi:uncharacterized protein LOC117111326 isoform X1 [Anneissia japonica]|uniref:uncharacterized protein LOC117111326 isoform X1 n=1 Tax=Anneissia japonica TaxID=1529436 RepID=UPI0014254CA3|nr:uncharacterized protein LOC117111326 isoform X1 [Anneissia japonica]
MKNGKAEGPDGKKSCMKYHSENVDQAPVSDSIQPPGSKQKNKPHRPFLFCGVLQSRLSRHMLTKHKDTPDIVHALKLPEKEKLKVLTKLRLQGIYKHNEHLIKSGKTSELMTQRKLNKETPLVVCSCCKGYYSRRFLAPQKSMQQRLN